jgi:outer membrane protein assembly factor BamB
MAAGVANCATTNVLYQVTAGADDGYAWSAFGQDIAAPHLVIGDGDYSAPYHMSAMRFNGVTIPRSALVYQAHLRIQSISEGTRGQIYGVIRGEAADSAADFSARYISEAAATVSAVSWDHKFAWEANTRRSSPDISAVVQEIITRPGWNSGNSLAIIYSTRADSGKSRMFGALEMGAEYAAVLQVLYETYVISGYVRTPGGSGVAGVTVSAGAEIETAVTDGGGFYELQVPPGWSGTVTLSKASWGFEPPSRSYSGVSADQLNQDFTGILPKISGYIRDGAGAGLEGVLVSASNGGGSDTTDSSGYYEITVYYGWSGTVTPTKSGWGFNPQSRTYGNVASDQPNQDYLAFQPKISGYVRDIGGAGMAGVSVSADSGGGSDTTDSSGYYEITVPYLWSGSVTPSRVGWGFTPPSRPYSNVAADQISQDYTAFQPVISGYVRDATGSASVGVLVSAGDGGGSDTTDATGYYEVTVPYNWSGTVTPSKEDWGFTPASRSYGGVVSDRTSQDYTAFQPWIAGYVKAGSSGGPGMEGVLVWADNGGGSAVTGADGYYKIAVQYGWSGTVTPSKEGWGFTPVSRSYNNVVSDITSPGYIAFQPKISGHITDSGGAGLEGVLVSANNGGGSDTTDSVGYYEVTVPYDWWGTVTPTKEGWGFTPSSRSYGNVTADQSNEDYSGIQPTVSGYIKDGLGTGIDGVLVSADNGGGSYTTAADGYYEITLPYLWSGTVTPAKAGWAFDPNHRAYENLTADEPGQDYTAFAPPVISGIVADANGTALAGVVVTADNGGTSDTTDANGFYEVIVPQGWWGTVTPEKAFWFFEPGSRSYENLTADISNQDYGGVEALRISGWVRTPTGAGISGVEVWANNGGRSDTTDGLGFYELAVPPGWSGAVTPGKPGRLFDPPDRSYTDLADNLTGQDFVSLPLMVRSDGTGDFPTIQAAIDASFDGDEIIVEPGIYRGAGNRDIDFGGRAIILRSIDPEDPCTVAETVVDCESLGRGFYFHNDEEGDSVLNGLTITNGYANTGGGISCYYCGPTIANCVITGNTATDDGGGVHGSEGPITDCIITGNQAGYDGGGIFRTYGPITNCVITGNLAGHRGGGVGYGRGPVSHCTIVGNHADYAGGGLSDCWGRVENCSISGNYAQLGGGVFTCSRLSNCTVTGNWAGSDGGGIYECEQVSNCIVVGNSAGQDGGGMYCCEFPTIVTNSTFVSNAADYGLGGGIIASCLSTPILTNTIVWANSDSNGVGESSQLHGGTPDVSFSCIEDDDPHDANIPFGGADSNNIDDYPMFVRDADDGGDGWGDDPCTPEVDEGANDDFGDLHLQRVSPCINAGNPHAWPGPDGTDIDGEPRVMGGTVDVGADEFPIPMIIVTRPRGGEVWVSGSRHEITWLSEIYEGTVDILFSSDAGGSVQTLETGAANTGVYLWHLPEAIDSNQCLILVIPSVFDPNVEYVGSGVFTVRPDGPGPAVSAWWRSLGGEFDRAGLSKTYGPEFGCIKWQFEVDGAISAGVTVGPNETVYVPCEDGRLYKLDADGVVLWSYDASSPLISSATIGGDGTVYVGAKDGKLHAVDIDGSLRWTHTTDGFVYSSPAVSADGNSVYVCSDDGSLYALGGDGSELWSFATGGFGVVDGSIFASPAIAADGTVYIGGMYDSNLYALEPEDGSVKWVCHFESGGWLFASPVIGPNGTIYQTLVYDPNLYAIDPCDGSIVWATHLSEVVYPYWPSPKESYSQWFVPSFYAMHPHFDLRYCDFVYYYAQYDVGESGWSEPVLGPDGTIYVSFDDPHLRAVDPNGSIKWIRKVGSTSGFSLTAGSDGLIYGASNDSNLYVLNPDGLDVARFDSNDYWLDLPVISAENTLIAGDSRDNSMLISYENNRLWAIGNDCGGRELDLYWQEGPQDVDGSGTVDFRDFAKLAVNWLKCTDFCTAPCGRPRYDMEEFLAGDVNKDLYVNFFDVAILAQWWLAGH